MKAQENLHGTCVHGGGSGSSNSCQSYLGREQAAMIACLHARAVSIQECRALSPLPPPLVLSPSLPPPLPPPLVLSPSLPSPLPPLSASWGLLLHAGSPTAGVGSMDLLMWSLCWLTTRPLPSVVVPSVVMCELPRSSIAHRHSRVSIRWSVELTQVNPKSASAAALPPSWPPVDENAMQPPMQPVAAPRPWSSWQPAHGRTPGRLQPTQIGQIGRRGCGCAGSTRPTRQQVGLTAAGRSRGAM